MGHTVSFFLSQLAWSLPLLIAVVVIATLAVARRDDGRWWQLVVAGCVALLASTLVGVVGHAVLSATHQFGWSALVSIPALLLQLTGLGLLGAGAISGRRNHIGTR